MKETIVNELKKIEEKENVKILYAVESGSRAWGFESTDSDYDVRFIYARPVDSYLSVEDKRDVLEYPLNNMLDISGWDIKKSLRLFKKSNPPLSEWLISPIIYKEEPGFAEALRQLQAQYFSCRPFMHHHLNMARGNYREYLKGEMVRIKKYFYVLRPVLSCLWLKNYKSLPPMEFEKLMPLMDHNAGLKKEVERLLVRKKSSEELDLEPAITIINDFLNQAIMQIEQDIQNEDEGLPIPNEPLDHLFRETIKKMS